MTQGEALDILKLGHNVFLTGPAGSGKTFVLNAYINFLREEGVDVGITASTGIAATHMNGTTIHSWTGLGIRDDISDHDMRDMVKKKHLSVRFNKTKVLIIDEVSMLHHFRLDLVDKVCRFFKADPRPFGGMQVILCGDFFQLPPISRFDEAPAQFVDKSIIWSTMDLKVCYLTEQYRQSEDDALLTVLNAIRKNEVDDDILQHLRGRYKRAVRSPITPTKLYTHNVDVDALNFRELDSLSGEIHEFPMLTIGSKHLAETLKKSCLAPEMLKLKIGASVMFVKNNYDKGYVNGTLGRVVDFDEMNNPVVETFGGAKIAASPVSWRIEEDGMVKAELIQVPLRLAWAITIHKSQGMSLDAAEIDLSRSFVPGMGYVALSRVRSLSGMKLMGLNDVAMQIHPEVIELDRGLFAMSEDARGELSELELEEKVVRQREFLNLIVPKEFRHLDTKERKKAVKIAKEKEIKEKKEKLSTTEATKKLIAEKKSIEEMAKERGMTWGTIASHIEKLVAEREVIDIEYLRPPKKAMAQIKKAFKESGDTKLTPVKEILGDDFTYDELRIARLFL